MYKNKGKSRKIKKGRKSRRNKKSIQSRFRGRRVGGCDDCIGSSPPVAPLWNSVGGSNDIYNHNVDPIFYSSSN